ncbi:MAG TPA: hypothetical protein VFX58_08070 [Chitinophagaceae bacterium]|nr:hypothetical protein [Chitinophagaceae bacterium]
MDNDLEKISVEFNNIASKALNYLFSQFKEAVATLNRKNDENVFQQLLGKYLYQFRNQLEETAQRLLDQHRSGSNQQSLKGRLTGEVNRYVSEFMQKAKAL